MATTKFHFVEDYEKLVGRLLRTKPLDDAMSAAVGGGYEIFGQIEAGYSGVRDFGTGCASSTSDAAAERTLPPTW